MKIDFSVFENRYDIGIMRSVEYNMMTQRVNQYGEKRCVTNSEILLQKIGKDTNLVIYCSPVLRTIETAGLMGDFFFGKTKRYPQIHTLDHLKYRIGDLSRFPKQIHFFSLILTHQTNLKNFFELGDDERIPHGAIISKDFQIGI